MAQTSTIVVITACLVLIGSIHCMSDECTWKNFFACRDMRHNATGCRNMPEVRKCIDVIKPKCTDALLIQVIEENLVEDAKLSEGCPGLPKGDCYLHATSKCTKHAPWDVLYDESLKAEDKKKMCADFERHIDSTRHCIKRIEDLCVSQITLRYLKHDLKRMDKIAESCGYTSEE